MLWPNETGWFQPACRHDRPSTTTDCTLGGGTLCGGCFFRKSLDHADFTSLYWFSSGGKLLKIFLDEEGKQVKFWLLCVLVVWITQLLNKKFQFTIAMLMFLYLLNKINIVFLFLLTDSFIINDLGGILCVNSFLVPIGLWLPERSGFFARVDGTLFITVEKATILLFLGISDVKVVIWTLTVTIQQFSLRRIMRFR